MPRRVLEGNVISNKCDKTVTVLVERRYMHPVYKKYIKSTDKYSAHDENNQFNEGDKVSIIECRPISKRKRWMVVTEDVVKSSKKEDAVSKEKSPAKNEAAKSKPAKSKPAKAKKAVAKKTTSKKKDA